MNFRTIDLRAEPQWDDMVRRNPEGTVYHLSAWAKVLEATLGGRVRGVVSREKNGRSVSGGLPFIAETDFFGKRHLVSLPLTAGCNPLLPADQLAEAIRHVMAEAPQVRSVTLKVLDGASLVVPDMRVTSDAVCHHLDLSRSLESVFSALGKTSVRQRIRRADREGARVRWTEDEAGVQELFHLETETRYRHGLPPFPYRFFANMWTFLRPLGLIDIPLLEMSGRIVAAAVVLKFGRRAHLEYSTCSEAYFRSGANQRLIWEAICKAHQSGARLFDFGQSAVSNRSLIAFKEQWGAKPVPLLRLMSPGSGIWAVQLRSAIRPIVDAINRRLPRPVLRLEGRLLYRMRG
jgi:CelD/BcsL family acetyltransferase involved in cellulose biosynthesis